MFCSIFKFQGVVAHFLQASCRKWQRGLSCGVLPAVLRSGSFLLLKGLPTIRGGTASCSQASQAHGRVSQAHGRALSARLSLCRMALILMVFVNYGGGKYWYFKHSSWNGEALPGGRLADLGPSSAPRGPRDASPRTAP